MRIILASKNQGKLKEIIAFSQGWSPPLPATFVSLAHYPHVGELEETANTFRDNALMKAEQVTEAAGEAAMADDSGLEVDALGGAPGIYSARFAGEHGNDEKNNQKLLTMLKDVPDEKRTARFRCAIALSLPDGRKFFTEGTIEGLILRDFRGTGGFGYDPLFFLPAYQKTLAEISQEIKNRISHRAVALEKMMFILETLIFPEARPINRPSL